MPCYDERTSREYIERETHEKIDRLTRVCCELAGLVIRAGRISEISEEAGGWIRDHLAWDERRKRAEAEAKAKADIRRRALEKLTPEERVALGLK
jgi:hypothetical protein